MGGINHDRQKGKEAGTVQLSETSEDGSGTGPSGQWYSIAGQQKKRQRT